MGRALISCGGVLQNTLELLGNNFSFDKPTVLYEDGVTVNPMGAAIGATTVLSSEFKDEETVRAFYHNNDSLTIFDDFIYFNPNYFDKEGYFSNIILPCMN